MEIWNGIVMSFNWCWSTFLFCLDNWEWFAIGIGVFVGVILLGSFIKILEFGFNIFLSCLGTVMGFAVLIGIILCGIGVL
tara:strand:+ start:1537 stop:1776 length:240 start_codon:yes stop_codon:yes gene_type:complete